MVNLSTSFPALFPYKERDCRSVHRIIRSLYLDIGFFQGHLVVGTIYLSPLGNVLSRLAPDCKMEPSSRSLVMDNYWKTLKILRNLYCPNKTLALPCDI